MAYLKPVPTCIKCHKTAKVELVGQFNNSLGFFCATHGKERHRAQEAIEQANWKRIKEAPPERQEELRKMLA